MVNKDFGRASEIAKNGYWKRHVCLSVLWNHSAPTESIFMTFDI